MTKIQFNPEIAFVELSDLDSLDLGSLNLNNPKSVLQDNENE